MVDPRFSIEFPAVISASTKRFARQRRATLHNAGWPTFQPYTRGSSTNVFFENGDVALSRSSKVIICVPSLNEKESLEQLLPEIGRTVIERGLEPVDLLLFDDGSTDGTFSRFAGSTLPGIKLTILRSPITLGKSQALQHLFRQALEDNADFIVMMDADGQDDPATIPDILDELDRGFDLVNARRSNRSHPLAKRVSSKLFNLSVRSVTGLSLFDINSGMKGFSHLGATSIYPYMYGELHRVILVIAAWLGLEISEVKTANRPRLFGKTKYGFARGWRGFFDLMTIQFLRKYHSRPGHFFSGFGSILILMGALLAAVGLWLGQLGHVSGIWAGAPWMGVAVAAFGLTFISFGFVAELMLFLSKQPTTSVVRSSRE